jgi:hypothetical protein
MTFAHESLLQRALADMQNPADVWRGFVFLGINE